MKPLTALLAAALLAACGGDEGGITREQFIRANVALRTVSDTAPRVDSLRAQALRKTKVTPAQLQSWLKANERDPVALADTWTEISRRVEAADSARRPTPAPAPPIGVIPGPSAPGSPAPMPQPMPAPPQMTPPPSSAPVPIPPPPSGPQPAEPPPRLSTPKVRDSVDAPEIVTPPTT